MSTDTMQTMHLAEIRRAAKDLIRQVNEYTMNAGSRSMLLAASAKLDRVLDASIKTTSPNEEK